MCTSDLLNPLITILSRFADVKIERHYMPTKKMPQPLFDAVAFHALPSGGRSGNNKDQVAFVNYLTQSSNAMTIFFIGELLLSGTSISWYANKGYYVMHARILTLNS